MITNNNLLPLVSIVIPSYNKVDLLMEMVDCVRNQSYGHWELIIVDDGSTEDNVNRAKALNDNRIKVMERDRLPKGGQTCRNIGFENSTGKYVIFFDADDLLSCNCLEQRVQFMEGNPDLDFSVFPATSFVNQKDIKSLGPTMGLPRPGEDALTSLLSGRFQFAVWTNIYKRESLERKGIRWDEDVLVYQDFDYNLAAILSSLKFGFDNDGECDYYYRVSYSSDTVFSKFTPQKLSSTERLVEKTISLLYNRADYAQRKEEFFTFILLHFERLMNLKDTFYIKSLIKNLIPFYKRRQILRVRGAFFFGRMMGYNKYAIHLAMALFCGDTRYTNVLRNKILGR